MNAMRRPTFFFPGKLRKNEIAVEPGSEANDHCNVVLCEKGKKTCLCAGSDLHLLTIKPDHSGGKKS